MIACTKTTQRNNNHGYKTATGGFIKKGDLHSPHYERCVIILERKLLKITIINTITIGKTNIKVYMRNMITIFGDP